MHKKYFSVPATHGPELVTTGLIVRQSPVVYERPVRSVPRFVTAPALTFLFTGRDAACDHSE